MIKYVLFFWICFLLSFQSQAQYGISISPDYSVPIKELGWTYKPTPGIHVNIFWNNDRGIVSKRFGLGLGYMVFPVVADTLYYVVDRGGVGGMGTGFAVFSPFKMIHFKASIDFIIQLNDKFSLIPGIGIGNQFASRKMYFEDSFGGGGGFDESITWGTLGPRIAIEYKFNDNISLSPFFAYTFMIQMGNTNPQAWDYNENTGWAYHYYSSGLSLNYTF